MDLSRLRPLYARPGPWASVYLDASRHTEDAAAAFALRWRGLRESLAEQGAGERTLAALDAAVRDALPAPGLCLFATGAAGEPASGVGQPTRAAGEPTRASGEPASGAREPAGAEVALVEALSAPPRSDLARYAPLPHTMPLVAQRGEEVSWLRIVADRTGADLSGLSAGGVQRRMTVTGAESYPIRKVRVGGWSHARFQREAETVWRRNAGDVAAATTELADAVGPEVLVIAGDVRARQFLYGQLPKRWRERAVQTDAGSRAPGADPSALDDVTIQAIAEIADRRTREAIDRFGAQEGAGAGLAAVVAALQREQAEAVLIVDDPSSTDELWIGPEPAQLSLDPAELRAMGVAEPVRERADAAIVRALACGGAELVLVGPDDAPLRHGVGAILRYADASTRRHTGR